MLQIPFVLLMLMSAGGQSGNDNICRYVFGRANWLNDDVFNEQTTYVASRYFKSPPKVVLCKVKNIEGGSAMFKAFNGGIAIGIDQRFLKMIIKNGPIELGRALIGHELAHYALFESSDCVISRENGLMEEKMKCEMGADSKSASMFGADNLIRLLELSKIYYDDILAKDSFERKVIEILTRHRIEALKSGQR